MSTLQYVEGMNRFDRHWAGKHDKLTGISRHKMLRLYNPPDPEMEEARRRRALRLAAKYEPATEEEPMGAGRKIRRAAQRSKAQREKKEEKLYEVAIEIDGQLRTGVATMAEIQATLAEVKKRGAQVEWTDQGVVIKRPPPPPTPRPGVIAMGGKKGTTVTRPFDKEGLLTKQEERDEYVAHIDRLLAAGVPWYKIGIEVCGYTHSQAVETAYKSIKGGGTGGSLAALRRLRDAVDELNTHGTVKGVLHVPAGQLPGAVDMAPGRIIQVSHDPDWHVRYFTAVEEAEKAAEAVRAMQEVLQEKMLELYDAVDAVPLDFRGQSMMDRVAKLSAIAE